MTSADSWKNWCFEEHITIDRLFNEYVIYTLPILDYAIYRVYEKQDGSFYVVSNIKFYDANSNFLRPHGKGNSEILALKNIIININDIVLSLDEVMIKNKTFFYCNDREF